MKPNSWPQHLPLRGCTLNQLVAMVGHSSDLMNAADEYGHTPLISAVLSGNIEIVRVLLVIECDIECTTAVYGWTALHCAAITGNVEMAALLFSAGADARRIDNLGGFTPFHLAAMIRVKPAIWPPF